MSLSSEVREEDRSATPGIKHHLWKCYPGRIEFVQFSEKNIPAQGTGFMAWAMLDEILCPEQEHGNYAYDGMLNDFTWTWSRK